MPQGVPRPRRKSTSPEIVAETLDDKAPPTRPARVTQRSIPVAKVVSGTLEQQVSEIIAHAASESMLDSVGPIYAITPNEATNIAHPGIRMIGRRLPDIPIATKLSKADADDLELMIITFLNYITRIVDNFFKVRMQKQVARIQQSRQAQQNHNVTPTPVQTPEPSYAEEIQQIYQEKTGDTIQQAPMTRGGMSINELIERGLIPGDSGENVT